MPATTEECGCLWLVLWDWVMDALAKNGVKGHIPEPDSKLMAVNWTKFAKAPQGSLWEELQRPEEPQCALKIDMSEFETSAVVPKKDTSKGGGKQESTSSKPEKVYLINYRNVDVTKLMLIKMPPPDVKAAVLAMDESVLDAGQVENIVKVCPTKKDMELLKNYTGDREILGVSEQFFLEFIKVPRLESKLRVFLFKIQFNDKLSSVRKSSNIIISASDEVRTSVKFKEIMKMILYMGNTLDQGTARVSAVGFKLDSLLKIITICNPGGMSLVHYLCKVLASNSSDLLNFPVDLVNLESATKISLKTLAEDMQAINKGLENVKQELTASADDGPELQVFHKTLSEFFGFAEPEVVSVANLYSMMGRKADALALYFGENPATCPFEKAIKTLDDFVFLFLRAHRLNYWAKEEKKKAQEKAELKKANVF